MATREERRRRNRRRSHRGHPRRLHTRTATQSRPTTDGTTTGAFIALTPPEAGVAAVAVGRPRRAAATSASELLRSPRQDRFIRTVALLSLAVSLYYLGWRLGTFNPHALVFSALLWAAELYGVTHLALFAFTTWGPVRRRPRPAPAGLSVDVFITTFNEPLDILRKTFVAARNIAYPHETWVLDDGCRDEVRELALAVGVGYLPREESEHAKAGNLNNALALTRGDFVLQLDADHVPLPHILDRLLGYFDDPDVAFVQSPQDFYNVDSVTHVMDDSGRRMWEEQRIFFDVIQPGKDRWNAAFFCGSCGVIRRAALDDVGGFSTQTVVEDMETSILLHERGWKSAYVTESLAYGLSPGSLLAYQVQRLRWASGSMQVLRKLRPLFRRGLSWPQRLCYLDSCIGYLDGIQKVVLLTAPFVYFLTGTLPITTVDIQFLVRFFPYLFLQILAFELLARGRGYLWLVERFSMIRFPIYTRALASFFRSGPLPFHVTPKGSGATPLRAYRWQLLVLAGAPVALAWATLAHARGWVDYHAPGWHSGAFVLNAGWLLWNAFFAGQVVRTARRLRQHEDYRFREDLPVRFRVLGRTGVEAAPAIGITTELGASTLRFISATAVEPGDEVRVRLPLTTGDREIEALVSSRRAVERGGIPLSEHLATVKAPELETQTAIELHCVHHAVPGLQKRYRKRPDLFDDLRRFVRERRRETRKVVRTPAQVRALDGLDRNWYPAVLEELDPRGAQILVERQYPAGMPVQFHVPGVDLEGRGRVARSDAVETPLARRWVVGIRRDESVVPAPLPEPLLSVALPAIVIERTGTAPLLDLVERVKPDRAVPLDPALLEDEAPALEEMN